MHRHSGCRPDPELFGIIWFAPGAKRCCSDHEGDFKKKDGTFDREAAERQCVLSREWNRKLNAGEIKIYDSGDSTW